MVIPVPDSGVPAALGYAAESGIPFEYGIIRKPLCWKEHLLTNTRGIRDIKVRMKLSPEIFNCW